MQETLKKSDYIDFFKNSQMDLSEEFVQSFIQKEGIRDIDSFFVGPYKGRDAINFLVSIKITKQNQQTKNSFGSIVEKFVQDLKVGKFDGMELNSAISQIKKRQDDGREENISLAECCQIHDIISLYEKKLAHDERTFPLWDPNQVEELDEYEKSFCYDIAMNYSYNLFTREDYKNLIEAKRGNEKINIDSYISQIVFYMM